MVNTQERMGSVNQVKLWEFFWIQLRLSNYLTQKQISKCTVVQNRWSHHHIYFLVSCYFISSEHCVVLFQNQSHLSLYLTWKIPETNEYDEAEFEEENQPSSNNGGHSLTTSNAREIQNGRV